MIVFWRAKPDWPKTQKKLRLYVCIEPPKRKITGQIPEHFPLGHQLGQQQSEGQDNQEYARQFDLNMILRAPESHFAELLECLRCFCLGVVKL